MFWRSTSRSMRRTISVVGVGGRHGDAAHVVNSLVLDVGDLGDAACVAAALEAVASQNVARISSARPDADDAGADRQHVGVVVRAGQAGGVQVVAERGPDAAHLVGRELLALPAAAEHDADARPRRRAPRGRRRRRSAGSRPARCEWVPRSIDVVAARRAARSTRCCLSSKPAWSEPMAMRVIGCASPTRRRRAEARSDAPTASTSVDAVDPSVGR